MVTEEHTIHIKKKKKNASYFILSVWLARLLCVYKFPWVVLLPRNSNSWQGFPQIGDRGKPADARTLQCALSFWLRQYLPAQAYKRQYHQIEGEAISLTDQIPTFVPWGWSWKATISVGWPLEMPHTEGPCAWNRDETAAWWGHFSSYSGQVCH